MLSYSYPTSAIPNGFKIYTQNKKNPVTFPQDMFLKKSQITGIRLIPKQNQIAIFGYFQYYQANRISQMLLIDLADGSINPFGNELGGNGIDQAFLLDSGDFLMFGDLNLYSQPNEQLNYVASCSYQEQNCISLGNGLSDYSKIINALELDNWFVAYISNDNSYTIQLWDKSSSNWNLILKSQRALDYDCFSMEHYNGKIYISGTFLLSSENYA